MNRLLIANVLLTSSLLVYVAGTLAPFHQPSSSIHPGLHGHTDRTDDGSSGVVTSASQTNHVGPSITTTATMATGRDVVRHTTASPIDYCRAQPDNYAAVEPGSKCRRYFRCANHSKSVYLCPGKLVFNGQRCVHPGEYQCHNSSSVESAVSSLPVPSPIVSPMETKNEAVSGATHCQGKSDGYYQDGESGCRSYFYCSGGMKAIYVCPGKAVFDGQRCVEPDTYACPHSSSDCRSGATSVGNGYQADFNSGCRNYYFCSADGHKLITLTCSDDRLFNGKKCVDPVHYRCPSDHVTTTEKSKPVSASVQLDSYYSYSPQSPARKPSLSAVHHPPTFFVVSSWNGATTPRPLPAKEHCEKSYGFFAVAGTGCRHYYMCIGGSRSDLQCSGDTIFNGQLCVDPAQYACPESIHTSDCQGKTDGVYPDRQSGCRNYFLCLAEVQTNLSCPADQLFDGRRCTDSRWITCNDPDVDESRTNAIQSPCAAKTNGLYLDRSFPGCRGYLYCRAGRPYGPSGRCTRSERFSSQHSRCLPKHEVECRLPSSVDDDEEEDYMMAEASAMLVTIVTDDVIATTPGVQLN